MVERGGSKCVVADNIYYLGQIMKETLEEDVFWHIPNMNGHHILGGKMDAAGKRRRPVPWLNP